MEIKKTPFYDKHVELGGQMVPFAGFHMPMQFTGIVDEHMSVRKNVGIFDVSHMGEISVTGEGAEAYVNMLTTNDVRSLDLLQAQYTAMLNDDGGVIDDLLVYKRKFDYLLVVNAVNIERDAAWVAERAPAGVTVADLSDETAEIAVQGPRAAELMKKVCGDHIDDLGFFRAMGATIDNLPCLVSRTGYTGEDGFEIYAPASGATVLWDRLMKEDPEPAPCGLGARDSLRLEAALRLHGNDMDESTTPYEAGLGWIVKIDKGDFFGRDALLRQKKEGVPTKLIGLVTGARRFPRKGYAVLSGDRQVGAVTSGGFSPTLNCGIALARVDAECATSTNSFAIDMRGQMIEARYQKGPFYRRPKPE